ncbi:lytic murein transglycosylase [Limibaculum sp. FT325]|uniref:lytic murein transglycosylase n=1 Tax=Thermohalobaculum sediminis TaxID=2939436 RepID=UPI0020C168F6|nr:lytic murein transglycosylase [Limibaculum sediminis]MCL5776032.1 lytic murein transglycosylase [Limibaculum sediminis]
MTRIRRGLRVVAILVAGAVSAGCAAQANTSAAPTPRAKPVAPEIAPAPQVSFAEWRAAFRGRALAEGIRAGVFDAAFAGVEPNARVIELDRFQPEFARPIWEYLDSAVSDSRIATGRRMAVEKAALLDAIEARHGVDREVVLAIWGLESAYGASYGSIPVIESLATLAHDGRRRDFAEAQLLAALRILQSGDVAPGRMVGSWAGAMGHTQFIPTSFLDYAVDFTGDGRRDVWAPDAADALASTANYLAAFGWTRGAPVAVEARLPAGFDFMAADESTRRPAAEWSAMGVTTASAAALPPGEGVSILLPAGAAGPAFAVYPNFGVIRRYNNATSYALAVSHLAERIGGAGPYMTAWPRGERPLSRSETVELQERLTAMGLDTQGVDGIVGPNTRAAIRAFQLREGLTPDGYLSSALLARVRAGGS